MPARPDYAVGSERKGRRTDALRGLLAANLPLQQGLLDKIDHELDRLDGWDPFVSVSYACPSCGEEVDIRGAEAI
jgi:hypothetical protein